MYSVEEEEEESDDAARRMVLCSARAHSRCMIACALNTRSEVK